MLDMGRFVLRESSKDPSVSSQVGCQREYGSISHAPAGRCLFAINVSHEVYVSGLMNVL